MDLGRQFLSNSLSGSSPLLFGEWAPDPGGLLKRISEPEPCGECRWGKCHELSAIHLWFDLHEFVVAIA